jgi:ABC-type transport system involved in cytochrome c biogenesis permease subunit
MTFIADPEHIAVYCTMGAYVAAAATLSLRARYWGWVFYAVGSLAGAAALAFRWSRTGHVPLQNLYEVCMFMGPLMFPLSLFCRRVLDVGAEAADCLIGLVVLFPVAFIFSPEPRQLPPALQSSLFVPHVTAYLVAYVVLAKASIQAGLHLLGHAPRANTRYVGHEVATYRMVNLGFPLLTLGLALGALWGKLAWGDYWNWDPKELWSLATWVVFVVYFHGRVTWGRRYPRLASSLVLLGLAGIIITLLWVNLGRIFSGLHSYA